MSNNLHNSDPDSLEVFRAECLPQVHKLVDLVEQHWNLPNTAMLTKAAQTLVILHKRTSEIGLTSAGDIIRIAQDVVSDLQQNRLAMSDEVHDLLRLAADTTAVLIEGHETDDAFAAGLGAILRRMRESIDSRRRAA